MLAPDLLAYGIVFGSLGFVWHVVYRTGGGVGYEIIALMKAMLNQPRLEPTKILYDLVSRELALELQQVFPPEMPMQLGYPKVK